jgi:multidrug efflux pump subunit AcrA (membrane-fusion protein)
VHRQRVIGGIILLAAILIAALLIFLRSEPEEKPPEDLIPLVQAVPIEIQSGNLMVTGAGTVRAREELTLSAEVSGKLVYVNPNLREGQRVAAGTTLFRIDPSDYRNAVRSSQADVASQNVAVLQAQEEVSLAKAELARFEQRGADDGPYASVDENDYASRILPPTSLVKPENPETGTKTAARSNSGLVTREPQLQSARAGLRRAQAQLADAQKALQRTVVRAPFSGVVRTENIALGSYVAPGQSLGSMVGTADFEAVIPLSESEAALIPSLWRAGGSGRIEATVYSEYGGKRYSWRAYVDRANSLLNPQTRTIDVFLRIPNPLRGGAPAFAPEAKPSASISSAPPLFVGSFVDAQITGRALDSYASIPLAALRSDNRIWLVRDGKLKIVNVDIYQRTDTQALISSKGLGANPVAVIGALKTATEGQPVRIAEQERVKTAKPPATKLKSDATAAQKP